LLGCMQACELHHILVLQLLVFLLLRTMDRPPGVLQRGKPS